MLYRGTVRVSYTGNGKPIDELPDLPFDKIVLDGKLDEHVAQFLDENYPEIDHKKMEYTLEGGDSLVGFEYKGESPHSAIYIPSFSLEFIPDRTFYEAEFGPLTFKQYGGKRKSTYRKSRSYRKRR